MGIFSWTNITVSLVGLYIAYRVYWEATTGVRRRNLIKQHGCLPIKKRPSNVLLLGVDQLFINMRKYKERRLLDHWTSLFRDNATHTISTYLFGNMMVMTEDPENVKALLATQFDTWSLGRERIDQMASYLGHGIFTNEGKAWKDSRDLLRPCFERSQVSDISIFEKHTSRLIELLPKDGTTVNLNPLFHELTLDIATEFLFGKSTDALESHNTDDHKPVHEFIEAFEYCANPFTNENADKWGFLGGFLPDKKHKRGAKYIRSFVDKIIDEEVESKSTKEESSSSRYIFLDELLSQTSNRVVIRAELLNILLAGRDTTASLLTNTFFVLGRNPDILVKLRREITEHIGDEIPSYQQLKDMKYLRAIINETQRLYPIVPVNSREALADTTLPRGGGPDGLAPCFLPKGTYCVYSTYSMHRRPGIYGEDANEFKPERWFESGFRPGWGYIPFSGGPRVCIGQNFALTEAMFVIVRLLQKFEIEGRNEEDWVEWLSITCVSRGGAKIGLTVREGLE